MNISVFGLGYVGTLCAACLAERGQIIGIDKSETKVRLVRSGRSPIAERDIGEKSVQSGRLTAMVNAADAIAGSDISLLCAGTPSRPNGSLNLDAIEKVASEIGCAPAAGTSRNGSVQLRCYANPIARRTRQAHPIASNFIDACLTISFGSCVNDACRARMNDLSPRARMNDLSRREPG